MRRGESTTNYMNVAFYITSITLANVRASLQIRVMISNQKDILEIF